MDLQTFYICQAIFIGAWLNWSLKIDMKDSGDKLGDYFPWFWSFLGVIVIGNALLFILGFFYSKWY